MNIIIALLFIIITILSIIVFKVKGLFTLLISIPLVIMYYKASDIIKLLKKKEREKNDNVNLSERKEVEFVSSRDRKKGVKVEKKEKKNKSKNNESKSKSKKKIKVNIKPTRSRDNREKKKNIGDKKGIGKKILTIILGLAIFGVFAAMAFMIYIVISTGNFDPEALKNQDQTVVYDKDGNIFATLGAEKRESVEYDELPQVLIDALIATEDSRFYEHNGVDMARFLKATALNLMGKDDAGGASTLTMQTVKNNLTKKDSKENNKIKKIIRKFQDVYLSVFFMENKYSKNEILEMYVNYSCLVGRIYDPYKHPEAAEKRRNTVLTLMVRHGYITEEEKNMATDVSIESMLAGGSGLGEYEGYLDTVIQEVKDKTGDDPSLVSMKIYTALDRSIQDGINKVLSGEDHTWADDSVQAGIAITNVNDCTIVAIGAGRNRTAGDWNYATQALRQPGSTAKPIFDYGPGFEYNDFSTYTLFNDEPWTYTNGPEIGNWDGSYQGLITLRQALSVSRNIPALKAFQQVDKKNIVTFVNGLGIDVAYSTKSENYKKNENNGSDNLINEAYSIGGMSYGVTPLDMAEAYAAFANGGYHIETHAVTKIEYRSSGKTVDFSVDKEKTMADSTAYLMNNVLQYAVEHGFNGGARVYGSTVAAKTGTSNLSDDVCRAKGIPIGAVNDLWTVAYTPEYSVALWYGYEKVDKNHYLGGASAPKDAVMRSVMKYVPKTTKTWEMPSSVVAVTVEKETWPAKLPSEYTPDDMKITEYFKKGTQPTEISERYAKLPDVTNLKSSKTIGGYKLTWNWKKPDVLDDSYLSKYFSQSVFGKQSGSYLQSRINYNNNTLGGIGFGIYVKNNSGSLERIAFTTDNEYVYVPSDAGTSHVIVKAEYKSFKSNASNGTEISVKSDGSIISSGLSISLKGKSELEIPKADYSDSGVTATYNGKDVTTSANITYEVNGNTYNSKSDLDTAINRLDTGKYSIKYIVTYRSASLYFLIYL